MCVCNKVSGVCVCAIRLVVCVCNKVSGVCAIRLVVCMQ